MRLLEVFEIAGLQSTDSISGQMTDSPLDKEPSHETLKVLREANALPPNIFWTSIRSLNNPQEWAHWAARLCLLVGSALVLAAVIYFFAFNWASLGRLQKLGLLQVLTMGALIAGQIVGFRRIGGQLLLMAASIFVGVSFAVFGQVYQTGADAFGFFGIWAVCILPWVIAGAFAPLWVLWFILVNLTAWFFWDQVGQFHNEIHYSAICIALTALNGCGLVLREAFVARFNWLSGAWLRHLFLIGFLTPLLMPALNLVLDARASETTSLLICTVLWLICLGGAYLFYTRKRFDSTALCWILGNAAVYLMTAIGRLLDEVDLYESGIGFLLMALLIGGITTLIVRLLRWLKQRHAPRKEAQT